MLPHHPILSGSAKGIIPGVGVLTYVLIVLRPAAAAGPDPHGQMWMALVAAGCFAVAAIAFWAYFRLREHRAEAPA